MGDIYTRWLTPPGGSPPIVVFGDRFEVHAYALPDGGRLARSVMVAPQEFPEYDQFVTRLREAIEARETELEESLIIVLREVVGGLVTDEELVASLSIVPAWIAGGESSDIDVA